MLINFTNSKLPKTYMVERFKSLLENLHLSAAELADTIGVQRSTISHILSGRNKPSIDFLEKILNVYPEVNVGWLITGKGTWKLDLPGERRMESGRAEEQAEQGYEDPPEPEKKKPHRATGEAKNLPAQPSDEPVRHIIIVYRNDTFRILDPA